MEAQQRDRQPLLSATPPPTYRSSSRNSKVLPEPQTWKGFLKQSAMAVVQRIGYRQLKTGALFLMLILPAIAFAMQEEAVGFGVEKPEYRGLSSTNMARFELSADFEYPFVEVFIHLENRDGTNVNVSFVDGQNETLDSWVINSVFEEGGITRNGANTHFKMFESDNPAAGYAFEMTTDDDIPIGVEFRYHGVSRFVKYEVVFAAIILGFVYVLIIFELIHRTLSAMLGSFITLGVLSLLNKRPSLETVIEWIDMETIMLLFGMMVIVGVLSETGVFEFFAVKAYKISGGKTWPLLTLLITFAAVVSAFLDNVTTILLLVPVTIRMCNVIGLEPTPILLAEVMFSNIGGTATAVGDPPNVIIVSSKWSDVPGQADIEFTEFTLHLFPGIIIVSAVCYLLLKIMYKKTALKNSDSPAVAELKREIRIWSRTLKGQSSGSKEERKFCERLVSKIQDLELQIDDIQTSDVSDWQATVKEMEIDAQIKDYDLLINSCVVLTAVILMFFLHSIPSVHLDLGWIAVIGAMALLLISGIHNIEELMTKVEWATLLFFGALFILMEGLAELGLISYIGENTATLIKSFPDEHRQTLAIVTVLWVSALASAFIDNIPFTTAMIPVIKTIANDPIVQDGDLQMRPLVWALAFGACLGGNGTLIGASANVVMAGLAEQEGISISFNRFFKIGFPMMLISTFTAMLYLLFCHSLLDWR